MEPINLFMADFAASSGRYAELHVRKAARGGRILTPEAKAKLPDDLRDDVDFYVEHVLDSANSLEVGPFLSWRAAQLSVSDRGLLNVFADNLAHFVRAALLPGKAEFREARQEMRELLAKAVANSEEARPFAVVTPQLPEKPSEAELALALLDGVNDESYSIDVSHGAEALERMMQWVSHRSMDSHATRTLRIKVKELLTRPGFEAPMFIGTSTSVGEGGEGGIGLVARHTESGKWLGLAGRASWL